MSRRFVFADAHAGGVPREQRQVYVLVSEVPSRHRLVVCREGDEHARSADIPVEWLEELAPPIPAEPEPGAYLIGSYTAVRPAGDLDEHWLVLDKDDDMPRYGFSWMTWERAWAKVGGPDVAIRRLVPEVPTEPVVSDTCPIPFPGYSVASPLGHGGWVEARSATQVPPPEYDAEGCGRDQHGWYCSGHFRGWHVASTGREGRVGCIWPIAARDRVNADRADSGTGA